MARRGEPIASERLIQSALRQKQALELRLAGVGYRAIADTLDYAGPSGSHKAVLSALHKTIKEPAEEVRTLEVLRLDAMLFAIWQDVKNGDLRAIDRALRISERRAKIEGLDKPLKVNIRAIVARVASELGLDDEEAAEVHDEIQAFLLAAAETGGDE